MSVDIEVIGERVRRGDYLIKSHAVTHALKEGFDRKHMVEAVLNGKIIEEYPNDQRVLVCGKVSLTENARIYLHIVCEYAEFILTGGGIRQPKTSITISLLKP